mmetsp:Transcript_3980/g.10456  ORF Transcript_3980/g.10456 Transcript_3980/m.10456 type:complete len:386 (+) Transcript_3980:137-1294(+)
MALARILVSYSELASTGLRLMGCDRRRGSLIRTVCRGIATGRLVSDRNSNIGRRVSHEAKWTELHVRHGTQGGASRERHAACDDAANQAVGGTATNGGQHAEESSSREHPVGDGRVLLPTFARRESLLDQLVELVYVRTHDERKECDEERRQGEEDALGTSEAEDRDPLVVGDLLGVGDPCDPTEPVGEDQDELACEGEHVVLWVPPRLNHRRDDEDGQADHDRHDDAEEDVLVRDEHDKAGACEPAQQLDRLPVKEPLFVATCEEPRGAAGIVLFAGREGLAVGPEGHEEEQLHPDRPDDDVYNGHADHRGMIAVAALGRQVASQVVVVRVVGDLVRHAIPHREDRAAHTRKEDKDKEEHNRQEPYDPLLSLGHRNLRNCALPP